MWFIQVSFILDFNSSLSIKAVGCIGLVVRYTPLCTMELLEAYVKEPIDSCELSVTYY